MNMKLIAQEAKKELARRSFFDYCNLIAPDFYKPDREYLVNLCNSMQEFYESETEDILIVNTPPRHGKSRTASLFTQWVFGKNREHQVMIGSYNKTLSVKFSKAVRNGIMERKLSNDIFVYNDVFPETRIKRGESAMQEWAIDGSHMSYLATSPDGTATGFGCDLLIIDDLIKNYKESLNETTLEQQWDWFSNTMLSRVEEGGKTIVIMTRWSTNDLAGRLMTHCEEENEHYRLITYKALQDDGTMLCDEVLSRGTFEKKKKKMNADLVSANYQQIPIDIKGKLYPELKTYDRIPTDSRGNPLFTSILSYCDTADSGEDYLCNIIWGEYNKEAYILDVIYTKEGMEVTEQQVAKALYDFGVNQARIESNHGASAFPRAVGRILKDTYNTNKTNVTWFHQSKNKKARIISNAPWVMNHIYFPNNWRDKWQEFYKAVITYQKEGKNKHDDSVDTLTGVAETMYLRGA